MKIIAKIAPFGVLLIAGVLVASLLVSPSGSDAIGTLVIGGWLLITGSVGALIALRQHGHPVGVLLVSIAVVAATASFVQEYAVAALTGVRDLLGGAFAGWVSTWLGSTAVGLGILLVLLFPTGKLPSARWRIVAIAGVGGGLLASVATAFIPGPLPAIPSVDNPLGISGAASMLGILSNIAQAVGSFAALAAVFSQIVRVRRAQPHEAAQIKIVAFAIVMAPLVIFVSQVIVPQQPGEQWLEFILNMLAVTSIPVAIGVAILKHRLYDIDVIINRALVYAALTAGLLTSYVVLVFALGRLLEPLTRDSDIAVAASTLAVAALFRPLRTRVQAFIDSRFYRHKYDATWTLESFSNKLRDQIDLETLNADVIGVVTTTMRPAHASVWLRHAP